MASPSLSAGRPSRTGELAVGFAKPTLPDSCKYLLQHLLVKDAARYASERDILNRAARLVFAFNICADFQSSIASDDPKRDARGSPDVFQIVDAHRCSAIGHVRRDTQIARCGGDYTSSVIKCGDLIAIADKRSACADQDFGLCLARDDRARVLIGGSGRGVRSSSAIKRCDHSARNQQALR